MDKNVTGNSINVALNALKFMMEEVLRKNMRLNIRYSKVPERLPIYLTKDEIRVLLRSIANPKQKLLVSLMYGAGLRVGEAVKLKKEDFDLKQAVGWVRAGKGNKDRLFIIPDILKQELEDRLAKSTIYLFQGAKGHHYSVRSVQMIIKRAAMQAGIKKDVSPHTLRHSFATHLIESGKDITVVQALLGHKSPDTTMVYLHIANPKLVDVKSPLDDI